MAANTCWNCGNPHRPGARFCSKCGAVLPEPSYTPPTQVYSPPPTPVNQPAPYQPAYPPAPPAYPPPPAADLSAYPALQSQPDTRQRMLLGVSIALLAVFVVLESLLLPLAFISQSIADEQIYLDALDKNDFYQHFPIWLAETLDRNKVFKDVLTQPLTLTDWQVLTTNLFSPAWLQSQTETALKQFFSQARDGKKEIKIPISLVEIKQRLSGEQGKKIYETIMNSKQECTFDDMGTLAFCLIDPASCQIPLCKIPFDQINQYLANNLSILSDALPDQYTLTLPASSVVSALSLLDSIQIVSWIGILLLLPLLAAAFISRRGRTLDGWLLLWGGSILAVGALSLLISLAVMVFAVSFINLSTSSGSVNLSPGMVNGLEDVVRGISIAVLSSPMLISGLLILLGGAMAAGSLLLKGLRR